MSYAQGAYVSVENIVDAWLLRHGKQANSWWKILPLAAEAVRELSLTSGLMIQHTILTKTKDEAWFTLPYDFTDYLSVGIRQGDMWRPIPIEPQLMPFPDVVPGGQFTPTEHTPEFDTEGNEWKKWYNNHCYGLDADGYYGWGFPQAWWGYWSDHVNDYGQFTGRYFGFGDGQRTDICYINPAKNIAMVSNCFCNELYLVYVGVGKVDTMTHIDVRAQAAIEAYISWKYEANKRNNINAGKALKEEFQQQHAIFRARINTLGITELGRILYSNYGVTQRMR